MRINIVSFCFSLIVCALLVSCDDAFLDTNVAPPETENPMEEMPMDTSTMTTSLMTAKVNGADWEAEAASALIQVNRIGISGLAADGSIIILSLEDNGEGVYELTENGLSAGAYTLGDNSNAFTSNSNVEGGTVEITELNWQDSTMSGTFFFTGARAIPAGEVKIEVGKFDKIPVRTELGSVNDFNKVSVKVDEVLFEPVAVTAMIDPFSNNIAIVGTAAIGIPSVALYLPQDIIIGTYDLGTPGLADYGGQYNIDDMTFLGAESGQVMVTKHDKGVKIIEGTFFFKAAELVGGATASLTEGSFMVSY